MNIRPISLFLCFLLACSCGLAKRSVAALPIDLEVAKERGVSITAPQQWAQLLGRMNLGSVKIRDARGPERAQLESKQIGNSVRYRVVAILTRGDELLLPDRRFRVSDRSAMQKYFQQLPEQAAYNAEERGRFGLTKSQFERVFAELSQPVEFSTVGKTAEEILRHAEKEITTPIERLEPTSSPAGKPITSELKGVSLGTTLAFALRQNGLMLVPEQLPGQALRLTIESYDATTDYWPVGWKPGVLSRRAAPQLFEKRNIEIKGFTLTQALEALQPAMRVPVIFDERVLRRNQIEPSALQVVLPKKRTHLKSALGKMFSQARLSDELRVDELDKPFLWVTRFGKDSPRATE